MARVIFICFQALVCARSYDVAPLPWVYAALPKNKLLQGILSVTR